MEKTHLTNENDSTIRLTAYSGRYIIDINGGQDMILNFETNRLFLRLFEPSDAKMVQVLAGNVEVAGTTLSIPHPYPDGVAEGWIEATRQSFEKGDSYTFAMVKKEDELHGY
ncbi:GNAT family N-acetyltransferase [Paenibacillus sp. Soil766]|uniref:GNAT family N-acetyltransferase n=1 Tax=Paenibacillus sp. Soil766 TaxID=1736404 RepID=UPI0012F74AC9|nr:GNAT family N-acetyltransferase [Paenibacillus sp. Soil766]